MQKAQKTTTRKKAARSHASTGKAIIVRGLTRTKGTVSFRFTPVSARALRQKRNKAYQYFTIN
jgi:hypothetical protein